MERKKFLEMCQRVAVLPSGILGVKQGVPEELTVVYGGIRYYPVAYEISFNDKGETLHTAILHDLKINGIVNCNLERVEVYEKDC